MQDQVMPTAQWEFDENVTAVFDDMLARSIPQYEVMRAACTNLAMKHAKPKTVVLDIGCSRGEAIAALIDKLGVQNYFIGIEVSKPMIEAAKERFKGLIACNVVSIKEHDLKQPAFNFGGVSVAMCVLTLQFTPIEYRLRILKNIYDSLNEGGALILVEKVIGSSADIDTMMVDLYYDLKGANGYTQEQIAAKRKSLEGVLVPVTAKWNEEMLRATGFTQVDCFWRWMNFAGWVAIK